MQEFEIKNNVLIKYHEQEGKTEVIIPDGIIEIRKGAFTGCNNLYKIIIPDSVENIGTRCFSNCSNLRYIKLPNKLTSICNGLFELCTSLCVITLPKNVTYIGDQAFDNCENLTSIVIPDKVRYIRDLAFWECKKISEITIPNSVKYIGNNIFFGCENLKKINIFSYDTFSLMPNDLKAIILNTIIKNKQQFSEDDKGRFKKYIKKHKMSILNYNDLQDLLNYMLNNMGPIYTEEEVDSILNEVTNLKEINNKIEITGMLLEYKKINFGFKNILDSIDKQFDLGEFNKEEINLNNDEEENEKGRLI